MPNSSADSQGNQPAEASLVDAIGLSLPSWVALAVLALVGGVLPIALARHFGAWGIPRNDDWSYILTAFRFADSGKLNGNGWASMNLVGQLVLSLPVLWLFGHRIAALQVEVATFGVVGLLAVFDLARQVLSPRRALFVALMVAVGPMWASLSASYMTDVPAFALAMICLALGARAVRPDDVNVGCFWAAVLVGFAGFSVREYAIVAPLAVCLAALWAAGRWSRPRLTAAIAALLSVVGMSAIFLLWRRGLPGFTSQTPIRPSPSSAESALHEGGQSAVLVGLLVSPAVLLAGPKRLVEAAWARAPRTSVAVGLVTVLALCGEAARHRASATFLGPGNYVLPNGIVGSVTVAGTRPDLLPTAIFALLALVGILSALLLALAAVPPTLEAVARIRQKRLGTPASPPLAIVTLAALGYGLACALPRLFGLASFDRYLLPLIALVGVLVLQTGEPAPSAQRGVRIIGAAALLGLALFGLIYAANSASFDGTKWRVAEQASKSAGSPKRVEGGFEWTNYHAGKQIFFANRDHPAEAFCVALRTEPHPPGKTGKLRAAASVWGPTGTQTWIVARQRHRC